MSLCAVKNLRFIARRSFSAASIFSSKGDYGTLGLGGDIGGSIREDGGKFGERKASADAENVYFKKVEAEQLEALKMRHHEEIKHHEEEIQRHLDVIKRHRKYLDNLKKMPHQ